MLEWSKVVVGLGFLRDFENETESERRMSMRTSQILKESNNASGKEEFVRFMKRCGFKTVSSQVEGVREDGSICSKTVWELEKLPGCKGASNVSLTFLKDEQKLRLSYPHPLDCREIRQFFDFDVSVFLYAYGDGKYERSTPKDYYMSFQDTFFELNYPKANKFVRFCFYVFSINPTIVKRCVRQNKGLKRKIDLEPKNSRYFEFLGLERKIIHTKGQKRENGLKIDVEKEQLAKRNMEACIKNAAIYFDLNYFKGYLEAYIDLQRARRVYANVSKRKEQILLEEFSQKVRDVQKQSEKNS